ncbi:hypothetical protein CPB86DRAFT_697234 [Serendipita vermifera]|nr:hypothetical protein CPB86DRAFT_697234 [Serendipita vermifera]
MKVEEADKSPIGLEVAQSQEGTLPRPSASSEVYVSEIQMVPTPSRVDITGAAVVELSEPAPPTRRRRISFRSFGFFYGNDTTKSNPPSTVNDNLERVESLKESPAQKLKSKREAKKIEKAAIVLRSFLLGPFPDSQSKDVPAPSKSESSKTPKEKAPKPPTPAKLSKANNQLLSPDQANKVIAKLRTLPVPDGPPLPGIEYAGEHVVSHAEGPIHAVCLDCTEEEADRLHFSRLSTETDAPRRGKRPTPADPSKMPSIASANLSSLIPVLRDIHIVTLVSSPDLGFGQPPDSQGPLAGSVPSPAAVTNGMMEITGQLLALGFATSKAVFPDHAGVYPPTDRMSVLTYWWGLEVCLPPPTLQYLSGVKSVQNAALNFLTAISLFNNGVREILPFVRYISQFLDFQWSAIQAQNKGDGVVCAATWVCPAALVPRPWDFPDPPPGQAAVLPKATEPTTGPTLVFPGRQGGNVFTPNSTSLPPVVITPATLPRGAKFEMLKV